MKRELVYLDPDASGLDKSFERWVYLVVGLEEMSLLGGSSRGSRHLNRYERLFRTRYVFLSLRFFFLPQIWMGQWLT